jgi:hypothetical protein
MIYQNISKTNVALSDEGNSDFSIFCVFNFSPENKDYETFLAKVKDELAFPPKYST